MGSAREGSNPFLGVMSFEEHAENLDLKGLVITMVLSALGFLVALQWRDAIKATIDAFVPVGEGLTYTYTATIAVTIVAVVITYILIKLKSADLFPDRYENRVRDKARRAKERAKAKARRNK